MKTFQILKPRIDLIIACSFGGAVLGQYLEHFTKYGVLFGIVFGIIVALFTKIK